MLNVCRCHCVLVDALDSPKHCGLVGRTVGSGIAVIMLPNSALLFEWAGADVFRIRVAWALLC